MTETIMTDPVTGGKKGIKREQLGSIDPLALRVLAEVAGMGAEKYDQFNYLKGYDWAWSYNALQRHAHAFWEGEDLDPESGLPHMAHVAWHALALVSFFQRELGTDTRFKQEPDTLSRVMNYMGDVVAEAIDNTEPATLGGADC